MPSPLNIDDFLQGSGPILDVRSLGEYEQGHIPGAVSFPLFTDDERAQVGTCYKQVGREAAVELGFDIAGPKCGEFIRAAKALAPDRHIRVHCWRGGMRSGGMGWILELAGFTVHTLIGGYKAHRRWVRDTLASPKKIVILGGMTGSGKTLILQELAALGEPVLDLEALANHRGSSFGALLLPPQPSTEHYENLLAEQWAKLPSHRPIWLEAESRRVGTCRIPNELFAQMEAAPAVEVVRSLDERLDLLVEIYGEAAEADLVEATERIRKRLGGDRTQAAIQHIQSGNLRAACAIILDYYDRAYRHDLKRRGNVIPQVNIAGLSPQDSAQILIDKRSHLCSDAEAAIAAG
ncbi:tRNA 2-selenouridine(34) synthase MnmH [Nodosilinea sp. LEGE 06152]|uniref:tRNA 2-selenouridine(34) synthase MnmH n=1 Tax=Nodosilinea sp. LEGE 06152 TaxID=2777966 RepID=UPI00187E9B42|nr:tRNA 2-selenouridine(34) synthase MnmH [Nodosilinea sp. LEGE 06152]MBE9158454.1 tRNA 2-selenouridine(34) synthase MnmH [Nodosilinea sp. LEGE 06152]